MADRRRPADRLHLPPGIHYDCLQCGRGCTDFWEIPLDAESEAHLLPFEPKQYQQRDLERDPFVDSQFDKGDRALCRQGDVCVFLTEERLCALHAALGPKNKPQTCIDFPFRYVDTPGGTYVGLSFACTAVLRDHGEPVEGKQDSLAENYTASIHVKQTADRPHLTGRVAIDFSAYEELERAFEEILALPGVALGTRLLAQSILMDLMVRTFEVARMSEPHGRLSEEERAAARDADDGQLATALIRLHRDGNWGRLLMSAQRRAGSAAFHRAFIGLVSTFRQALWRDANRLKALTYIAQHYLTHALRLGRVHVQPFPERFAYDEFRRRRADDTPGSAYDRLLTRYFRHVLFRKDLLLAESIQAGHRFMLMQFALVNWYITAMMVQQDAAEADESLLQEALSHVEKYYNFHSTYGKYLERQPLLATLIDWATGTRAFAASMVRAPV